METARTAARPFGSSWLDGSYVRRCLQRLVSQGVDLPSGAELASFAAHELRTSNASRANFPPGVVFNRDRLAAWQARPKPTKKTEPAERVEPVDPDVHARGLARVLAAIGGRS